MGKTVFLGVEGSGKTTLAMALLRAFGSHKAEGWYMRPLSRDSFRFVETMPSDFLKEGFPAQTSDLHELSWQLECNNEDFGEIEILDYPGEIYRLAFLDEKDERDKEAFRQKGAANKREIDALLGAIKAATSVFVLFSLEDAIDIKNNPRNLDAVWITYECINLLKKLDSHPRIRLLFTQADKYLNKGNGIDISSLHNLNIIIHDHRDIEHTFVSVVDPPESEHSIDQIAFGFIFDRMYQRYGHEFCNDIFFNPTPDITPLFSIEGSHVRIDNKCATWGDKAVKFLREFRFHEQINKWPLPSQITIRLEDLGNAVGTLLRINGSDDNPRQLASTLAFLRQQHSLMKSQWGKLILPDLIAWVEARIASDKASRQRNKGWLHWFVCIFVLLAVGCSLQYACEYFLKIPEEESAPYLAVFFIVGALVCWFYSVSKYRM